MEQRSVKLTPMQRAINDATKVINIRYRFLQRKLGEEYVFKDEMEKYFGSFTTVIPNVEGNKTFLKKVCQLGTILPFSFLLTIFTEFKKLRQHEKIEMYRFIEEQSPLLNEMRDTYIKYLLEVDKINPKRVRIRTNDAIKDISDQYKETKLTKAQFIQFIAPKLIKLPQIKSFSDMYEEYLSKAGHRTVVIDDAENFLDYTEPEANVHRKNDRHAIDIRNLQQRYAKMSPWKTVAKIEDYAHRNRWDTKQINGVTNNKAADSIDMKKQRKLMKHYVSGRYGFVFDYLLTGRFRYLIAININTRKAFFAIPKEIIRDGHNWRPRLKGEWMPDGKSAIDSVKHLLELTPINSVLMDQEGAFIDAGFKRFLEKEGIQYRYVQKYDVRDVMETKPGNNSRSTHSGSLVDRLMRTLRLMNYNLGNNSEIEPPMMNYLIDVYNNSVHGTLSKIIGQNVTPNMVDADVELETAIVKHLRRQNFLMENNPDYQVTDTVRVYNDIPKRDFEKVKPKLLPGQWKYIGRENGLFKLRQKETEIMVPRWMIKNDGGWSNFNVF